MKNYYSEKLAAERLKKCYEIASPRVQQYLEAEIEFVLSKISPADTVLELGCGYGRVLKRLIGKANTVVGIDTSVESLQLARKICGDSPSVLLSVMNAVSLGFRDRQFDVVLCIQNGISAFHVEQKALIREAMRVTRPGGRVLFSSYSGNFWEDRLAWFQAQAEHRLIGEIADEATGNGVIVGKDGFRAITVSPADFLRLTSELQIHPTITEVDRSSIFCEIVVE